MSVKVFLQGGLTVIARGRDSFEVEGNTVIECLQQLISHVPKLEEAIFFESREGPALRSHIKVKVNKKDEEGAVLPRTVVPGDEILVKKQTQ